MGLQKVRGEHEFGEIAVVGEDLDRKLRLAKEVAIVRERIDNRIEFFVGTVPSFLAVLEFVVKKEKGVPAISVFLFHGAGISDVGGVSGESNGFLRVEGTKENIIPNCSDDLCESSSMKLWYPFPRNILFE